IASTPLVIRTASLILETSAFMNVCPFGGLSGRRSERRSLYLPASSRLRCVPTSPVAPVMSTVFILLPPVIGSRTGINSGPGPELGSKKTLQQLIELRCALEVHGMPGSRNARCPAFRRQLGEPRARGGRENPVLVAGDEEERHQQRPDGPSFSSLISAARSSA